MFFSRNYLSQKNVIEKLEDGIPSGRHAIMLENSFHLLSYVRTYASCKNRPQIFCRFLPFCNAPSNFQTPFFPVIILSLPLYGGALLYHILLLSWPIYTINAFTPPYVKSDRSFCFFRLQC